MLITENCFVDDTKEVRSKVKLQVSETLGLSTKQKKSQMLLIKHIL